MDELQTMTPPATEGQDALTASPQVAEPGSQVPAQHQQAASAQVENGDLNASSQEEPRRASDFETARHIKRMAKQLQSLQQAFERSQQQNANPSSSQTHTQMPQITNDELLKDPMTAIRRMIQSEVQGVRTEMPQTIQQAITAQKQEQARQEALKMIRTNSSVKADPEGEDKIKDILEEEDEFGNSLNSYALSNPRHAAQLALIEYQNRFLGGKRSQSAPSKAQMQTVATSVSAGAPRGTADQEVAQLYKSILTDPSLMNNSEFRAKLDNALKKSQMESALQNK